MIFEQTILVQLTLGIIVVAVMLPCLLVTAGIGAAMLLWFVASGAVLGILVFWLVFPGTYGLEDLRATGHWDSPWR